jgi:flavin reductase (DIM6/NTAB) family NADH-FMN oxidoreductase RutF
MDGPPTVSDPDDEDRLRRRVLWSLPTGLYLIGSRAGDQVNLMTANLVVQVATHPRVVAVAVESGSVTRRLIEAGGGFTVSILDRSDRAVVRRFVKPATDVERGPGGEITAVQGEPVHPVSGGFPVLAAATGWLACRLLRSVDPGEGAEGGADPTSHVLLLGEVVGAGESTRDPGGSAPEVLRMEDTRMNYGG